MKSTRLAACALLICCVALIIYHQTAQHPTSPSAAVPSATLSASPTPASAITPKAIPVRTQPTVTTAPSLLQPAAPAAAATPAHYHSQPIAEVIRGLAAAPSDWRTFNPATLALQVAPGVEFQFARTSLKETPERTTWFGYDKNQRAFISASATRGLWTAEIFATGADSHRITAGTQAVVTSAAPGKFICADIVPYALNEAAGSPRPILAVDKLALTQTELTNINVSSVAVLYDADTEAAMRAILTASGSTETPHNALTSFLTDSIDIANAFLYLSEIENLYWELAGVAKIPAYDLQGDNRMRRDMDVIIQNSGTAGTFATKFFTDSRADQGVLIVGGARTIDGLGETPGNHSVIAWYNNIYLSVLLAHEMGHNFGCNHDRLTEQAPDGNGIYAYGYSYTIGSETYSTIMSYTGDYLAPYYSNPEVTDEGVPVGIAADQPKAAYNARKIREQASFVASFRKHADDPVITLQPANQFLQVGQTLTLSLTATGPNLKYQWYRNNQPIADATTSTYTRANLVTTDTGDYQCVVSTYRATLGSDIARITVATNPPPSSGGGGSGGGGGGGGGGGAPSLWFLASLALAALYRGWMRGRPARA